MKETNTLAVYEKCCHYKHWGFWLLVLVVVTGLIYTMCGQKIWLAIVTKSYQAVFLSNGQVYFGKLSSSGSFYKLTDIYYLQATQPLQQTGTDTTKTAPADNNSSNIQLVKLGSELHGPQDVMFIERDKVLFWENMKTDSKVVDAINKYKSK